MSVKGNKQLFQSLTNKISRREAYMESPFKSGDIHLSAPSMYTRAIESLDLQPGQSVLVIGSGTGYFACLASYLVGRSGVVHGIEVKSSLMQHSRMCIQDWKDSCNICRHIRIVEGNAFNIDIIKAMNTCLYDRIYIGAGCPEYKKNYFCSLLADGGNLVAPISDTNRLILVHKYCDRIYQEKELCHCYFASMIGIPTAIAPHNSALYLSFPSEENKRTISREDENKAEEEFRHISKRSELMIVPMRDCLMLEGKESIPYGYQQRAFVSLPSIVWSPSKEVHSIFPENFRQVVQLFLLANITPVAHNNNPFPTMRTISTRSSRACIATLPLAVCFHILSFCARYVL